MLRLLHLSDIHFGGYGPYWDEQDDQRDQLIMDVRSAVEGDGQPVNAILIGGDIAFAGNAEEYERATGWIEAIAEASGCAAESVWMVPGNHDVDRAVVDKSHICREFRKTVRACEGENLDELLKDRLATDEAGNGLIEPLKAYNDFAFGHGCTCTAREPFWFDDTLELAGERVLLWGVNSVLISDASDANVPDEEPNLVLGNYQSTIRESRGRIRIVICHHPPSHLRDWSSVKPYFDRAHLALFGHVHRQEAHQDVELGPVHVHAGAVGPQRGEGCGPSYNLLSLKLQDEVLSVAINTQTWDDDAKRFKSSRRKVKPFQIRLDLRTLGEMRADEPPIEPPDRDADDAEDAVSAAATPLTSPPGLDNAQPAPGQPANAVSVRELAVRFLSAPPTCRLEIARRLGVLTDSDMQMDSDRERYAAILARIRDHGLIDNLAEELRK